MRPNGLIGQNLCRWTTVSLLPNSRIQIMMENKFQWRFQCSEVLIKQTKRRRSNFVELSPLCIFIVVTLGLWYNPMLVFVSGDCIPLLWYILSLSPIQLEATHYICIYHVIHHFQCPCLNLLVTSLVTSARDAASLEPLKLIESSLGFSILQHCHAIVIQYPDSKSQNAIFWVALLVSYGHGV